MAGTPFSLDGKAFSAIEDSVSIRDLTKDDLKELAQVHLTVFPGYFLAQLGENWLQKFYEQFTNEPDSYGLVALNKGKIIGFVVGTTDSSSLFGRFYQRNALRLGLTILRQMIFDKAFRQNLLGRIVHIRYALFSLLNKLFGRTSVGTMRTVSKVSARLLSIGVLPEFRGQNVSDLLVNSFCQNLHNHGIELVGLSVLSNNPRAISFYEKTGWRREAVTDNAIYYVRSTHSNSVAQ